MDIVYKYVGYLGYGLVIALNIVGFIFLLLWAIVAPLGY